MGLFYRQLIQNSRLALLLAALLTTLGCDVLCKRLVKDVAYIQNLTGQALSIDICAEPSDINKSAKLALTLDVESSNLVSQYKTDSYEEVEVASQLAGACPNLSDTRKPTSIQLAPSSFSTVKLCRHLERVQFALVTIGQNCPNGYEAQVTATPCQEL